MGNSPKLSANAATADQNQPIVTKPSSATRIRRIIPEIYEVRHAAALIACVPVLILNHQFNL